MEDKVYKLLIVLSVVMALVTAGSFLLVGPKSASFLMLLIFVALLVLSIQMHKKYGKDVVDFTCSVDASKHLKPGEPVNYSAQITAKAAFTLNSLSVTILSKFTSDSGVTYTEHKERKIHVQNKQYTIGNVEKIEGSFILPRKERLFAARHSWEIVFHCDVKSALDKKETIQLKNIELAQVIWDAL
jgi:hypothetical protein